MKHTTRLVTLTLSLLISLSISGTGFARAKTKAYQLKTCLVTDNDLDSMGDKQGFVHNGQQIKVCCEPCIGKFKKNPAKYLAKLK